MALWDTEGDADTFGASGLRCILKRNHIGVWAGYVAIPHDHPLYGQRREVVLVTQDATAPANVLLTVHGGVRFTGMLPDDTVDDVRAEGEPWRPVPPRQPPWYIGFDCGHQTDYKPADPMTLEAYRSMDPEQAEALFRTPADYRDINYARAETMKLAAQVAALAGAQLANVPAPSAPVGEVIREASGPGDLRV
jgi:hypothetical protein